MGKALKQITLIQVYKNECHSNIQLIPKIWLNLDLFREHIFIYGEDYRSCARFFYSLVQIIPKALHSD